MIKQALQPIRHRLRLLRMLKGLFLGLLAGAAGCLVLTVVSFFIPIEALWRYLLSTLGGCAALGLLAGMLLPVSVAYAARRADQCGLKERVRTALAFPGKEGAMYALQRADAEACLKALEPKSALPFRFHRGLALPLAVMMMATVVLFFVPNPQHGVLAARAQVRKELGAQADEIEQVAEKMREEGLTEAERRELRRITDEMARDLREAQDKREALAALDEKEKQMERLQEEIRRRVRQETMQALSSQDGLKNLAAAMEGDGGEAMQEALSEIAQMLESAEGAQSLSEQLAAAATQMSPGAVQQSLSQAASAASAGNAQLCTQSLSGALSSAGATGADLGALMRMARMGVAGAGTSAGAGSGMGSENKGGGRGAGMGSTNQDMGYTPGMQQAGQGNGGSIVDKVGQYERIYDPNRLGGDNEASFVEGVKGEGESQQLQLGPGQGDYSGSVPYNQVIGTYQAAAGQAMRRQALPAAMQDIVTRYFDALID